MNLKFFSKFISIFVLIVIVFALLSVIFYLDQSKKMQSSYGLKDYASFKAQVNSLNNSNIDGGGPLYTRSVGKLSVLESNASAEDKFAALVTIASYTQAMYSSTNEPRIREFLVKLGNFAKENFPSLYKTGGAFDYPCQDPTCQTIITPADIKSLIEEIKNSDVDQDAKETYLSNLINATYLPANTSEDKTMLIYSYSVAGYSIKNDEAFAKDGFGDKIYSQILAYLQKTYPSEYAKANIRK